MRFIIPHTYCPSLASIQIPFFAQAPVEGVAQLLRQYSPAVFDEYFPEDHPS
jgi:hypothetical protein